MNPIDEIELELLEVTGDIDLAEEAGRITIETIRNIAVVVADVSGLDADAFVADVLVSLGITEGSI